MKNLQLACRVLAQVEVDPERFNAAVLAARERGCTTAGIGGHAMLLSDYGLTFTVAGDPIFSRPSGTTVIHEREEASALLGLTSAEAEVLFAPWGNDAALDGLRHLIKKETEPSPLHPHIKVRIPRSSTAGDLIAATTRALRARGLDRDLFAYERDTRCANYPEVMSLTMQLATVRWPS